MLFSTTLMFSTTSFSQPIVILEYRGSNNQNLSEDNSNNIFMMDPDHTEKHTVPKGPKSFCTAKPKFYVCWSNSAFAKLKPNSSNGIGCSN